LIPQFRSTPDAKFSFGGLVEKTKDFAEKAIEWVEETLHMSTETLTDGNEHFSAENNSSVISLFIFDGKKFLFTGDADAEAIGHALDYAISQGISVDDIEVLHVPHHGSKHNVGPTLLNRLKVKAAQISASPNASKHPSKKVINAFLRRGSLVYHNGKQVICHKSTGAPLRRGYGPVQSLPFNAKVEK
jgi:beta-lactamase superfamily II metal-dependent hydrolase